MSETGKTVSSAARTKKVILTSQLRALHQGSQDADRLLANTVPADDDQRIAEHGNISEFVSLFAETIRKTETLFEEFAEIVYDFVATKSADKELKRKEEENLEIIVEKITESNGRLAKLKGKQAKLTSKPSATNAAVTGPNTTNVQIDTSGLERSMSTLARATEASTQSVVSQLTTLIPNRANNAVHLPKLELTKFDGNILKFVEFWDLFNATIDGNTKLSDVEKLSYLTHSVAGEAAEAIAGLSLSNSNYTVARELLKERFGKEQAILNAHYQALVDLAPARKGTQSLRAFCNEVEMHVRSLEAAGQDANQELLIPLITSKLPRATLVQLEINKSSTDVWRVKSLREALSTYVCALEAADRMSGENNKPGVNETGQSMRGASSTHSTHNERSKSNHSYRSAERSDRAATSLFVNSGNTQPTKPPRCWYCSDKHFTDECSRYSTAKLRKEKIGKRCFICLREGHNASMCPDPWECFHCKLKSHHRSICPTKCPAPAKQGTEMVVAECLVSENEQGVLQTALASLQMVTWEMRWSPTFCSILALPAPLSPKSCARN